MVPAIIYHCNAVPVPRRYARDCSSNEFFILRAARLSCKRPEQGFIRTRLKSSLGKFCGRYGDIINHYEVSLSQILHFTKS